MAKMRSHAHGKARRDIAPEIPGATRQWAPLSTGFLVASIIGFFVSILYVSKFSWSLAVSFAIVFFCMSLASMISMARASPDEQLAARPIK
jgi:hypothetical protein